VTESRGPMTDQLAAAGGVERTDGMLVHSDGIEISPVADGYVVYHPGRDRVHHLNPTAALVLELCTGGNSAGDIGAALRAAFGPGEPIDNQIGSCINQLLSEGLIQPI
jgi:Coenzyme PQQ synthesis protein D (PqqD)